jgi:zinc D-Ala-D-Ala dipeptidase
MDNIVLMSDGRIARIPVRDDGCEHLAEIAETKRIRIDTRLADPDGNWKRARVGVISRLVHAADALPDGIGFLVLEAFRPPHLQERYFSEYVAELQEHFPRLTEPELTELASRYVSPPSIGPHCAGAAVDVTLCNSENGIELDLGTAFDATPEDSDGACYTHAPNISATARRNREILSSALTSAGMVNYPTEWWHYSYGDRYWAYTTQHPHALYSQALAP